MKIRREAAKGPALVHTAPPVAPGVILTVLALSASAMAGEEAPALVPKHLLNKPSVLYIRDGKQIVNAPPEDLAVARRYPAFQDKGKLQNGQRITIMTAKMVYGVGEEVRVIHVLEAPEAGHELYVMGPKPIQEEHLDGQLASPARAGDAYDGMVTKSPGVDFNYEISTYRFDKPGVHTIQWKGGGHPIQADLKLESNVLRITVTKQDTKPSRAGDAKRGG